VGIFSSATAIPEVWFWFFDSRSSKARHPALSDGSGHLTALFGVCFFNVLFSFFLSCFFLLKKPPSLSLFLFFSRVRLHEQFVVGDDGFRIVPLRSLRPARRLRT
jgi:hypothetical protein